MLAGVQLAVRPKRVPWLKPSKAALSSSSFLRQLFLFKTRGSRPLGGVEVVARGRESLVEEIASSYKYIATSDRTQDSSRPQGGVNKLS